jgi:hypothetical protein
MLKLTVLIKPFSSLSENGFIDYMPLSIYAATDFIGHAPISSHA